MAPLPPTVARPAADLAAELEKLFQDRAQANSPASQWEMVSLPLLREIAQVLRSPPQLSLVDRYWVATGDKFVLEHRQSQGQNVEEAIDDQLVYMDKLWLDMSEADRTACRERTAGLLHRFGRRPKPASNPDTSSG